MVVLSRRIYRRRHEKLQGNSCACHCLPCAELADGSVIAMVLSGSRSAFAPRSQLGCAGYAGLAAQNGRPSFSGNDLDISSMAW
jgi:hypothetical protein